jgi:hypothetical protein
MTKKVVVLGGGFAGSIIAKTLLQHKQLEVTLIDSKEYFEHTPSLLRAIVTGPNNKEIHQSPLSSSSVSSSLSSSLLSTSPPSPSLSSSPSPCSSSLLIPHASYLSNGKLIIGEVVEVSVNSLKIKNGSSEENTESISFDYLAVSSQIL